MKHILLLLVAVSVVVAIAFLNLPEDPGQVVPITAPVTAPDTDAEADARADAALAESERDERLERMKAVFARLERERRDLRIRLDETSYYVERATLTPAEAEQIREDLNKANRLLINPPLLGAFRDVAALQRELEQVQRNHQRLREILAEIKPESGHN